MILDNPPVPVPPTERPWLIVAGAAVSVAFAAAVGTKLGEWVVEELRHRFGAPPPPPPPPDSTETQT